MASSTKEQNWKQIHFDSGAVYPKREPCRSIKKDSQRIAEGEDRFPYGRFIQVELDNTSDVVLLSQQSSHCFMFAFQKTEFIAFVLTSEICRKCLAVLLSPVTFAKKAILSSI